MRKHLFKVNHVSYFAGDEHIDNYKCQYCGKVIHSTVNQNMNKHHATCSAVHDNFSTFKEDFKGEYDCSVSTDTVKSKMYRFYLKCLALLRL